MTEALEHITSDGDRWDLLAWRYYGDATQYERIIAANVNVNIVPVLASGIALVIPVVEEGTTGASASTELPPWLV
jgi:phage tail protein X